MVVGARTWTTNNQNTSRVFCIINLKRQQKHLDCSYWEGRGLPFPNFPRSRKYALNFPVLDYRD